MATKQRSKAKPALGRRPAAGIEMSSADRALVLQGGGALGSYQAGVYEALFEKFQHLDWWQAYPSGPSTRP